MEIRCGSPIIGDIVAASSWIGAFGFAALATLGMPTASARQAVATSELAWVGLFNTALVEWLENENQIDQLCSGFKQDTDGWRACRRERLAPRTQLVRLWHGPSEQATPAGSLRLVATPGKGLQSFFVPPTGGAGKEFRPDLFDSDWGYGPYFHVTFLERRNTWFRLPEEPFAKNTWINAADLAANPEIRALAPGDIVTSPVGDLFVIGVAPGVLRARPEQPADMWCGDNPPPLKPWKELRLPLRDVYTATGHLRLHIKYMRGC